jgi:hypothetical protein
MVAAEVQTLSTRNHTPSKQMQIIATGLLALNLASITGVNSESSQAQIITDTEQRKSRIAQSEKLYNELITVILPPNVIVAKLTLPGCATTGTVLCK